MTATRHRSTQRSTVTRAALSCCVLTFAAVSLTGGCGVLPEGGGAAARSDSVLNLFAPPSPQEAAMWAADPFDADRRQRGLLLLANAPFGGEPAYLNLYTLRLEDEDPVVRAVAVRALAMHGQPDQATAIATLLETDSDPVVRREAARALQRLHNTDVVSALINAADDRRERDMDTRAFAARALGQYAEPRVVMALIAALSDRRLAVNRNALDSLQVLTGEDFGLSSRQWLSWVSETRDLFAGRSVYEYPVFQRDPTIVEFLLPFWGGPPNETPGQPVGMPPRTPEQQRSDR